MIPLSPTILQRPLWEKELIEGVASIAELLTLLELENSVMTKDESARLTFPVRVPRGFVQRMRPRDLQDPLLLQVLPSQHELTNSTDFNEDPLQEKNYNPVPGLLHKYHGRVLLLITSQCAIHCRYCFRQHFSYPTNRPGRLGWQKVIDYIAADASIHEVIFSGGDPLIAPDHYLKELATRIALIPHVTTLRIHSRLPIVLPERICPEFLQWFTTMRLKPVLIYHCNHPNEIDAAVALAAAKLKAAGVTLLNHSVLLAGINDSVETLKQLSERLFSIGVLPYYLNLLDKVTGAEKFEISMPIARLLIKQLRSTLPGYLVPRLVQEVPGEAYKVEIT